MFNGSFSRERQVTRLKRLACAPEFLRRPPERAEALANFNPACETERKMGSKFTANFEVFTHGRTKTFGMQECKSNPIQISSKSPANVTEK